MNPPGRGYLKKIKRLPNAPLQRMGSASMVRQRPSMVSPAVRRVAQRNKMGSVVNRSPYALLGMRLLARRRR